MWPFVLLGCSDPLPPAPAPPLPRSVDPSALRFPDEAQQERYQAVRTELDERWGKSHHLAPTIQNNDIEEFWCPTPACRQRRAPGAHLSTFTHGLPDVYGLFLWVLRQNQDLQLEVHWSIDGRGMTGDAFLARFETGALSLDLSYKLEYKVAAVTVRHEAGSPQEVAAALWTSPTMLREHGQHALAALASQVQARLEAGEVYRCTYPKLKPNGGAPECVQVSLNAAELAAEQQRLDAWLAERQTLLATRAEDLHALVRTTVPAALYGTLP
jgi:hypothetical protein